MWTDRKGYPNNNKDIVSTDGKLEIRGDSAVKRSWGRVEFYQIDKFAISSKSKNQA